MAAMPNTDQYLLAALAAGEAYKGQTAPNPAVGAVVVKNDRILAAGAHVKAGMPHAEVVAIEKLTPAELQAANLFVTLEPCCHHGKTPPCTDLIQAVGISNVVYGLSDPNPMVAGQGAATLRQAGVTVEQRLLPAIKAFYREYQYWWQTGLPYVRLKLAVSSNHCIASRDKSPLPITGAKANALTHRMRWQADAILTSASTVLQDNPKFNARVGQSTLAKKVYVLDARQQMTGQEQIFLTAQQVQLIQQSQPLSATLRQIGTDGVHSLWVEVGASLFQQFVSLKLANEVWLYQSPQEIDAGYAVDLSSLVNYQLASEQRLGVDTLTVYQ